jgi:DNA-binding MurR/RpiR family transcriptional regulator
MHATRTVAQRLRDGLDGFPASERRVAHVLLADYPLAGLQSASDLARAAGVSTPGVTRLVARLGFAAYAQFQRRLRDELAAQLSSPLAKQMRRPAAAAKGARAAQNRFLQAIVANLNETFGNLPQAEFQHVAGLLADPRRRVHLVGGRFTDALARYLAVQLRILRPGVSHLQGQETNWQDQLLDFDARDVLLVFDIRRYQASLARLAQAAQARRASVVLLTDQWLSPIAKVATRVLAARVAVPSVWDSTVALMALVEALLAEVTRRNWDASRKRIAQLERLRDDGAPMIAAVVRRRRG